MRELSRLRGLVALVSDVVEHGSRAVEEVHASTASRAFGLVELAPSTRAHVRAVRVVHDAGVSLSYESVRFVTRGARVALCLALDVAEHVAEPRADAPASDDG